MPTSVSELLRQVRRLAVLDSLPNRPVLCKTAGLVGLAARAATVPVKFVARGQGILGKVGRGMLLRQAAEVPGESKHLAGRSKQIFHSFQSGIPTPVFRRPKAPATISRGFET